MGFDVPFIAPVFPAPDTVAEDYRAIVASNRFTNFGAFEQELRRRIAGYVSPDAHATTFSSATVALQAASLACFPPAAEARFVLMPSFTFAAAGQIAAQRGHTPLFVDVEPSGLHADPEAGADLLRRHRGDVAGILFANSFGAGAHHVADWTALADEFDLSLIIDSAAGFGSRYEDGELLGLRGTCEVFSLHATKPFAIGEGGALITSSAELADRVRTISNFGLAPDGKVTLPGLNGKLDELSAAIGLHQLDVLDDVIARRQVVLSRYREALPSVTIPRNAERSSLAFVTVVLPRGADRDAARAELLARGIEARAYYTPALHRSPQFAASAAELPVTEDLENRVLSLPCHDLVTQDVVGDVAAVVGTFV